MSGPHYDEHRLVLPGDVLDQEAAREDAPRREIAETWNAPANTPTGYVPSSGLPRPIDSYDWQKRQAPPIEIAVEREEWFEVEPAPRWMRPTTYRDLLLSLRTALEGAQRHGEAFIPSRRYRWALRRIVHVQGPARLTSTAGAYDMIGPTFELLREAKRRGVLEQVGLPTKRRLEPSKRRGDPS